jgi:hypothetical protein
MDRSSFARVALIAAALLLFWVYGLPLLRGKSDTVQAVPAETYVNAPGFVPPGQQVAVTPPEGTLCKIKGSRFDAELSTRGAALTHLYLRDPQYAGTEGLDIATTDHERWRSLRTLFRGLSTSTSKGPIDQVKYDRFDWKLDASDGTSCHFSYADDSVRIEKVIAADARPFELTVSTTVTNLSAGPHLHELSVEAFAYRQNKEIKSHLGRVSPFVTELSCARSDDPAQQSWWEKLGSSLSLRTGDDVKRKSKDDFKEGWFSIPLVDRYAAISNYYFAQALVPSKAPNDSSPSAICSQRTGTRTARSATTTRQARSTTRGSSSRQELQPQQSATYSSRLLRPEGAQRAGEGGRGHAAPRRPHQPRLLLARGEGPRRRPRVLPRARDVRQLGARHHRDDDLPAPPSPSAVDQAGQDVDRNAEAEARDRRDRREVQGRRPGQEHGHDGALSEARGEPARRMLAAARPDADLVRDVHDPADGRGDVPREVLVVYGPLGAR